jgi:hypothetical protein
MIRFTTIITAMFAMLLSFASPLAFAQQSAFQEVRTLHVKSGRVAEFQELISKVTAAQVEAGQPRRIVWQEVRGNLGTYHVVTPRDSYADYDTQEEPPMAPGAWANLISRLIDTVESQELILVRHYPQLGIPAAEDAEPPKFIRLSFREITWGGMGDYMS